jgi:hypothetical protein
MEPWDAFEKRVIKSIKQRAVSHNEEWSLHYGATSDGIRIKFEGEVKEPKDYIEPSELNFFPELNDTLKVGDRVEAVSSCKYWKKGDKGTVKMDLGKGNMFIQFDAPNYKDGEWWVDAEDVKLICQPEVKQPSLVFKVGDRVERVGTDDYHKRGERGERGIVTRVESADEIHVTYESGDTTSYLRPSSGEEEDSCTWNVLKLIDTPEKFKAKLIDMVYSKTNRGNYGLNPVLDRSWTGIYVKWVNWRKTPPTGPYLVIDPFTINKDYQSLIRQLQQGGIEIPLKFSTLPLCTEWVDRSQLEPRMLQIQVNYRRSHAV